MSRLFCVQNFWLNVQVDVHDDALALMAVEILFEP